MVFKIKLMPVFITWREKLGWQLKGEIEWIFFRILG